MVPLLKLKPMSYDTLNANEWSVKVLFAEKELQKVEGVFLKEISVFNQDQLDTDSIEDDVIYKYIDLSCISSETGLITKSKAIKGRELPVRARLRVKKGDILLSTVRPNQNNVAIVTKDYNDCIVNNIFVVIRPNNFNTEMLYFLLRNEKIKYFLNAKATGSAIPTLKLKDIMDLKIPIQENAEKHFDQAEDLFQQWLIHNQSIKTMKQVTEEQFTKNHIVSNEEKKEENTKLFQVIPYKNLEDRLDVMYYYSQESSFKWLTPIKLMSDVIEKVQSGVAIPSKEYKEEGVPYIRIKDMQEGFVSNEELTFIDRLFSEKHKNNLIQNEDILLSRVGTIGKAVLVTQDYEGAITNQHISIIKVDQNLIYPEFLMLYLNTSWAEKQLEQRAKGAAQKFINAKSIMDVDIPVPSLETQKRIVADVKDSIAIMDSSTLIKEIEQFTKQLFK